MKPFENRPDQTGNDRGFALDWLITTAVAMAILLAIALSATQAWAQLPTPVSTAVSVDTNGVIIYPTDITAFLSSNGIANFAALTNALGSTANPTFGTSPGTYLNSASVAISCNTPNATIKYTLDGTTPNATNGTTYSGSITFTNTKTLKAYASSYYRGDSGVTSGTYTISGGTKVYYGRSSNATLSGTDVEALGFTTRITKIDGTYTFASGSGYYWFAWPVSFDSPATTVGFVVNAVPLSMADSSVSYSGTVENGWTYQTVTGTSGTYKVYRSAYNLGGANVVTLTSASSVP